MAALLCLLSATLYIFLGCRAFPIRSGQLLRPLAQFPTAMWRKQSIAEVGRDGFRSSHSSSGSGSLVAIPAIESPFQLDADRAAFDDFCKRTLRDKQRHLSIDEFVAHPEVSSLLASGEVELDSVWYLWRSLPTKDEHLSVDDAYEVLHMVRDLPDPEEAEFVQKSFRSLTNSEGLVSFDAFLSWSDVKEILVAGVLTVDDLAGLWEEIAGSRERGIAMDKFRLLNRALDDRIEDSA